MITPTDLRASPNALARHYSRFRVGERLLLTGHSHQAWPDVAVEGQLEAFDDAARHVDAKWERAMAKAAEVAESLAGLLGDDSAEITLGSNTHELVVRFLSALDLRGRPRLVTTDGEFHTLRRQLSRLAEEGIDVVRVPASPVETLAERLAAEVDGRTGAVLTSSVMFETSRIVPGLGDVAATCAEHETELLVDVYHALGVVPVSLDAMGLRDAWVVGGGYKYLQLGEGNCFLRLPPHADRFRPAVTGWFAEFAALRDEPDPSRVRYPAGAARFAGSTYDPTSHYRAARVLRFHTQHGLTPEFLRDVSLHQVTLLARAFDDLDIPEDVLSRDRSAPREACGGFLALRGPGASALHDALADRGVYTDCRGHYLRFGPAPYLSDAQLRDAMAVLGEVIRLR
ncbi:kynureninase [Phytoactinopolyspora halotolerans]|uniref:Kynureninase n=1 Tax=Phytoactinopolyspora halotolerans TaxID=1981512 RepID=A0A6L9S4J4_9ACTN|nr:kynureninase [Phytoactinopolyspora halotolerans]NEE00405.1 kynureninase [Phytoactinopolyspora halotolerans]